MTYDDEVEDDLWCSFLTHWIYFGGISLGAPCLFCMSILYILRGFILFKIRAE